jgi:hypothetical protein
MTDFNDDLTAPKKYLRVHHAEPCVIKGVRKKEFKGQESVVVTFASLNDGALIDLSMKLPMNDFDKKKAATLMALTKASKLQDIVGKEVSVTVTRKAWEDKRTGMVKDLYNPSSFAPIEYTLNKGAQNDGAGQGTTDDIGF